MNIKKLKILFCLNMVNHEAKIKTKYIAGGINKTDDSSVRDVSEVVTAAIIE